MLDTFETISASVLFYDGGILVPHIGLFLILVKEGDDARLSESDPGAVGVAVASQLSAVASGNFEIDRLKLSD